MSWLVTQFAARLADGRLVQLLTDRLVGAVQAVVTWDPTATRARWAAKALAIAESPVAMVVFTVVVCGGCLAGGTVLLLRAGA